MSRAEGQHTRRHVGAAADGVLRVNVLFSVLDGDTNTASWQRQPVLG